MPYVLIVIATDNGKFSCCTALDFDMLSFYCHMLHVHNLVLLSPVQGKPPRTTATTLNVTVMDFNDNQPIFIGAPYSATWPEGTAGPLVVLNVTAIDQDVSSNGQIEYSISDGDGIFTVNSQTVSLTNGQNLHKLGEELI